MLISPKRYAELRSLQQLIYRAIIHFVTHYTEYEALLPLNKKARQIIEIASQYPYRVGTYRPDFLISEANEIHICEINARFPLNGYFNASVTECIANQLVAEQGYIWQQKENRQFLHYLMRYFGAFEQVCTLKSPADRAIDLRLYSQIFEKSGLPCTVIAPDELAQHVALLSLAAVINELNQMDLELLDQALIDKIAAANGLNDLRTIFLIHDKRFMAVLSDPTFLANFLTDPEIEFLRKHIIPTYTRSQQPELWEQARTDKTRWILKPYLLGKSEGLLAGHLTDESRWQQAFATSELDHMILQPFVDQKKFEASLDGQLRHDYVVGTFLCFDDQFFGPGRFRTSTSPITNQGDERKIAAFVTNQANQLKSPFIL